MGSSAKYPEGEFIYYDEAGNPINPETGQASGPDGEAGVGKGGYHIRAGWKGALKNFPKWWSGG
jgi:hypothetical protein